MVGSYADYVPTEEDINRFYKTKTLIVMEKNPMLQYNLIIKDVISREWNITEYDFISFKEFNERYRFDPRYSFLVMTQVTFDKDKTGARYKFLQVLLGGDENLIQKMPEIASVPLAYRNVEESSYIYKLATLLRFLQNHVELMKKNPDIISSNIFNYYNKNMKDIKDKTLYLVKDELAPEVNTVAKIKKVYPYKFELTTREKIEEIIKNRDPDAVFLHKVGPEGTHLSARCYKIIVGADNANFYYFDYHMINKRKPDGFLEKDFKKLSRGR
jgi:hypothetical protein